MGIEERETIGLGLARGEPLAVIARRLGRPTSTVSRDVAACGGRDVYRHFAFWRGVRVARRSQFGLPV